MARGVHDVMVSNRGFVNTTNLQEAAGCPLLFDAILSTNRDEIAEQITKWAMLCGVRCYGFLGARRGAAARSDLTSML